MGVYGDGEGRRMERKSGGRKKEDGQDERTEKEVGYRRGEKMGREREG